MFPDILDAKTKKALELVSPLVKAHKFYLAGGTALSLQFGHRHSIDLDWFIAGKIVNDKLKKDLAEIAPYKISAEDAGTLHIVLNNTKLSFLEYPYSLIYKPIKFGAILLADWRDIACIKLTAVSSRGSRKDFVDLYYILEKISLAELLKIFHQKYKKTDYSTIHILKSLVYFETADKEASPLMTEKISWPRIKQKIKQQVAEYLKRA